jgi:hypothetical protein
MEAGSVRAPQPLRWGAYGTGALAGFALVFTGVIGLVLLGGAGGCSPGAFSGFTSAGRSEIPANYQAIYAAAGQRFGIPPAFLAAIGLRESDHGRNPAANQVNPSGCVGPMQLGVGGACGNFFGEYKVDGDNDRRLDPRDPWDAIFTAANGLRKGKGLPPVGQANRDDYFHAACSYYGACADYAPAIVSTAERYGGPGWWQPTSLSGSISAGCAAGSAGSGQVRIASGANRPGVPLQPVLLDYLSQMAGIAGHRIVVTTGTNHSQYTVDGNVSDHWDGHAADLGNSANGGVPGNDRNFAACLILGGVPDDRAARLVASGGLMTLYHGGLRIQCIWKTYEGGDHFTHVHVGVRPL